MKVLKITLYAAFRDHVTVRPNDIVEYLRDRLEQDDYAELTEEEHDLVEVNIEDYDDVEFEAELPIWRTWHQRAEEAIVEMRNKDKGGIVIFEEVSRGTSSSGRD